eukprot:CAMPEP_0172544626 /NCGR_PEP_ID=MMETSP1067-20121228/14734_1 /TAXON_ID=265564 ORGANISM="Thalassiosira punctigera, Strain Tpunct2005C2" /NCGR_SAMPLE_ID=MMETSP1067 /ASSEMBLY_ACC=CAM_ASM_000444 /LENGTH=625 /DNA_ID=CAMNT_0013331221 /DNA_START=281 /DNA_END=2159 /DNA_ORIENTATION=+
MPSIFVTYPSLSGAESSLAATAATATAKSENNLSHHSEEGNDLHHGDIFSDIRGPSAGDRVPNQHRSLFAVAAASLVFVGASSSTLGHAEAAVALDTTPLSMPHYEKVRGISPTQNSLHHAFQRFLHEDDPRTSMKLMLLPTILSSDQNTAIKPITKTAESVAKENVKATQQTIGVANPTASESKSTPPSKQTKPKSTISAGIPKADVTSKPSKKTELQATDVKKIAEENKIDVELVCKDDQRPLDASAPVVKIDRETFSKIKVYQPPFLRYLPSSVQPLISRQFQSMQVLKSIPNDQLFLASVLAGGLTEMIRTSLLHPLSTIKARVQARTSRSAGRTRPLPRKLKATWSTALYEAKRGDLYAGIAPSLLVAVPASGVYSGMKEVSRRAFSMAIRLQAIQSLFPADDGAASSYYSALVVNLLAAFVADIAALVVRTPADVLTLRLQVFGDTNVKSDFGSWAKDSVALLPAMILTDIPFLLSRIFLNAAITTSGENLGRYELETITIACLCAFLTTPFDVARTRILLPTLPSEETAEETNLLDSRDEQTRRLIISSKYREQRRQRLSVLETMKRVAAEGNGGVQNLYAGWLERTAFLGIGRAWLDPLRVIGYLGIRDALLLKLFD